MLPSGEFSLSNISCEYKNSNRGYSKLVEQIQKIESEENRTKDLIFVTDYENKFLYANNSFLSTFQYTIAELINTDFNKIFFCYNYQSIKLDSLNGNQFPFIKKILSLKKDNSLVEININIIPIFNENGRICGYNNIITNHEENILSEEIIPKLFKEIKYSYKNFPDFYIKIDGEGNIRDFKYIDLKERNYTRSISIKGNVKILFQNASIKKFLNSFRKSKVKNEIVTFEMPINIDGEKKIFKVDLTSISVKYFLITLKDITKIKNSENEIKRNVSRFYALWNYSLDGMRMLNKSGIIIAVNPAFCKLVEMKPNDLIGKPYHVIYSEQSIKEYSEAKTKIKNAFNDRNFKNYFEGALYLKCNKKKYFDISSTIIESQTGNPLFERDAFLLSIFRDITERKKAEENITILKKAVESSSDIIFLTDKDGTISYINPAFTRIYGYEKDEVIGKVTPRILKSGKIPQENYDEFWETLLAKKGQSGELINRTRDGQEIYIEGTANSILNEQNEITGFLAVQRNITERKISEDALRNSELLFRSIWEKSHDGMRLSDQSGNIISVNTSFCKLVGMEESELLNKPFFKPYKQSNEENELSLINYKKFFSEKNIGTNHWEHKILHNGKSVFLDVSFSLIELKDKGKLLLSVFRDDTKYKKIEQELHNSERLAAIGTMSAFLAHEIKKPTSAIKSYVEMLSGNNFLSDDSRNTLELLGDAVGHLNKLLSDVLLFSQNKELIKIEIDLKSLIDKIHELLKKKLIECNIKFINSVEDIHIDGDYFNLISVFSNLIENAIDAISTDGEINISSESNDGNYSIFIEDSGKGITEKEKIFNPFFTTKQNGTGLGLSIVKKILECHEGSIKILSSKPGKTVFEIKFKRKNNDGKNTYN